MTRKLSIEEISENHAIISVVRNGEAHYYQLSLDSDWSDESGVDYLGKMCYYKQYSPIINAVHGIDDDSGDLFELSADEVAYVKDLVDCDLFYDKYENLFDNELVTTNECAYF